MARKRKKAQTLIKNYGLMWRRDYVFWGHGGNKGRLEGRSSGRIIDFRDQIGVYVLYDEGRRPIYIGQAGQGNQRLFVRLRHHTGDHLAHRWQYCSWFGLRSVNQGNGRLNRFDNPGKKVRGTLGSTLDEIEGVLIAATEPPFNKQGAKFKEIDRYRQVKHDEADDISVKQLRDLMDKTNKAILRKLDKLIVVRKKHQKS